MAETEKQLTTTENKTQTQDDKAQEAALKDLVEPEFLKKLPLKPEK